MSKTVTRADSTTPHGLTPEPPSSTDISLHRLVRCARLTPAQAAVVAVDTWHAAGELRSAASANGSAPEHAVRIDEHGTARLDSAVSPAAVVAALCGCVGGPPTGDEDDPVESALVDVEAAPDRERFERLADAVASIEPSARAELGALVTAWTGARSASVPRLVPADEPAPERTERTERALWQPRPPRPRLLRRIWHHLWRPLAGLVVFAVVVGVELTSLRGQLERDLSRLGGVPSIRLGRPSVAPTPSAPSIGPAANGAVLGVTVRTGKPCRPGARCPLTVSVRLRPVRKPTTVDWSVRVVDPCHGSAPVTMNGGSVRVHAGGTRVVAVGNVRLPDAAALEVYAVTNRPATAASAPLQVPATKTGEPRC